MQRLAGGNVVLSDGIKNDAPDAPDVGTCVVYWRRRLSVQSQSTYFLRKIYLTNEARQSISATMNGRFMPVYALASQR